MSGRTRTGLTVIAAALVLVVAVACAGTEEPAPRPPTPTVMPTAAGGTPASRPTASASTPTSVPATASNASAGDAAKGKTLFTNSGCSGCHSTSGVKIVGPGLGGLKDRAGSVVPGMSADAYIEQSIRQPNAHLVEGYPASVMPATFANLSAQEMADLLAYLNSL